MSHYSEYGQVRDNILIRSGINENNLEVPRHASTIGHIEKGDKVIVLIDGAFYGDLGRKLRKKSKRRVLRHNSIGELKSCFKENGKVYCLRENFLSLLKKMEESAQLSLYESELKDYQRDHACIMCWKPISREESALSFGTPDINTRFDRRAADKKIHGWVHTDCFNSFYSFFEDEVLRYHAKDAVEKL